MSKTYNFLDLEVVNRPYMDEIRAALDRVALSGRYVGGPEVDGFERMLAAQTGTDYAVGVSNGLDALRMIFRALVLLGRLHEGDEVLVPANTYIASILAVTDAGLVPVAVDIDPATSNMSAALAVQAVTPRTRAMLPVHLYGRTCWSPELKQLAIDHDLWVVEDNAQAIGAEGGTPGLAGRSCRTGALGHAAAFSFYPTKNIGALGDAGAVTTDDAELAAAVRALANYGSDRRYHNIYAGFNCRLDPVQAAVLSAKLPHVDAVSDARRRVAGVYLAEIKNPLVELPAAAGRECVWHQFVVCTRRRDAFREYLTANGVGTDINYPVPPYKQPCYAEAMAGVSAPATERQAATLLCLPVSACTSEADAREIAAIINNYREE
ncbi:MAG: DegT/DnrJ/EryC1/StrS family aminotransferase [Muribaculaceae bacterium]|nr:DegT/DnrJ/EryC1/StrS family aminotransferase [Muribaculaceae bacterium]